LEPEPERETMGPVGPNWFGSVVLLENLVNRTEDDHGTNLSQNPKPIAALILCIRVFKAFIVRRRRRRRRKATTTSTFFKRQQASK
jgi:hypothetical protein